MSSNSALAFDELPRGASSTSTSEQIARTLRESGIDAPSGLYDEALNLAREGALAPAAERLRMLLVLDPTDADAALFLGKILAQRGQFQEALANLDSAVTHGAMLPPGLRDRVEAGLQKQIRDAEEHRNRVAAREKGEIHTLREEAKKLRSDNAGLELEVEELQRRVRLWSSATAVIAGVASALVLAVVLFGGDDSSSATSASDAGNPTAAEALVITPSPETIAGSAGATSSAPSAEGTVSIGDIDGAVADSAPAVEAPKATAAKAAAAKETAAKETAAKETATSSGSKSGARTHTVAGGDTLGSLAGRYYGKASEWPRIQEANKAVLKGSTDLKLGMKLTIPAAP